MNSPKGREASEERLMMTAICQRSDGGGNARGVKAAAVPHLLIPPFPLVKSRRVGELESRMGPGSL